MKLGGIFKTARKGAKKVGKARGGAAPEAGWPEGTRIGVFGHENVGKTVFFAALYTQSKTTANFHISVRDDATANEFFRNDMAIKGIDIDSGGAGTIAAKSVPKRFPDRTVKDIMLRFTAILDGGKKMPVVTYDYGGRAASISEHSDDAEKIRSLMADADGLLFFFDPKILAADPEVQARVSSFVNILSLIASLKSRLPIPVGLVITKADTLPGYTGEDKTILIRPEDEQVIAEDYDDFLERVLGFESLSDDREWASSVRNVLVKLREFIRVVVGRTLDFQIFFVSGTGNKPQKIGAEVGRSIYAPPDKVNPCGVTVPFHWMLNSIVRARRLNAFRKVAGYVAVLSIVWIALFSLPYAIHFGALLRSAQKAEDRTLKRVDGYHRGMSYEEVEIIRKDYGKYKGKFLVGWMFKDYKDQAEQLERVYRGYKSGDDVLQVNRIIRELALKIGSEDERPKYDFHRRAMTMDRETGQRLEDLRTFAAGDERDTAAQIAKRAQYIWGLYERYLMKETDAVVGDSLCGQGDLEAKRADASDAVKLLCKNACDIVLGKISSPSSGGRIAGVEKLLGQYEELKLEINKKDADPRMVLETAPEELEVIRKGLVPGVHDAQISAINSFVNEAKRWEKRQTYKFRVQVPDQGHIHIEVVEPGGQPKWEATGDQIMNQDEVSLDWKPGNEIHIAFDEVNAEEHWGRISSESKVLDEKYALFDLEEPWRLARGKEIKFTFKGGLREKLPKLK